MDEDNRRARGRDSHSRKDDKYKRRSGDSRGRPTEDTRRRHDTARYHPYEHQSSAYPPPDPAYEHAASYGAPSYQHQYASSSTYYPPQEYERSRGRSSYGAPPESHIRHSEYSSRRRESGRDSSREEVRRNTPPERTNRQTSDHERSSSHSSRSLPSPKGAVCGRYSSSSGDSRPAMDVIMEEVPMEPLRPAAPHDLAKLNGGDRTNRTDQGGRKKRAQYDMVVSKVSGMNKIGKAGTDIFLKSNYFRVKTCMNWNLQHYHVTFEPDSNETSVRKRIFRNFRDQFHGFMFSGASLYVRQELTDEQLLLEKTEDDGSTITITLKHVGVIAPTDLTYLQLLGIVYRQCMEKCKMQLIGRNYYDVSAQENIDARLSIIPGFQCSIRQHEDSIMLCADISCRILRRETAYDIMYRTNLADYKGNAIKELIGSTVLTKYNNATYRIDDIDWEKNPLNTFSTKNGDISFIDYYKRQYNINIGDRKQALLIAKPKRGDRRTKQDERCLLIPELCNLTGISENMRKDHRAMKPVTQKTCPVPRLRVRRLMDFNRRLQASEPTAVLNEWGMRLDNRLVEVKGRILKTPIISYGNNETDAAEYDWDRKLHTFVMKKAVTLHNWHLICARNKIELARGLVSQLAQAVRKMGMRIGQPQYLYTNNDNIYDILKNLTEAKRLDSQFTLVLIANNSRAELYTAIKVRTLVEIPLLTQVVTLTVVNKRQMAISTKIAVQINCKMNGMPWLAKFPKKLMIVGFDISRDTKNKDIAYGALVACTNIEEGRFFSIVKQQDSSMELADSFALNMMTAIRAYMNVNNQELPDRIFIYRDGVGDGQLAQVNDVEVKSVVSMLEELYEKHNQVLKMGFIVVTKRINTRFFTMKDENPPSGTVVDAIVTMPERHDFYLISQRTNAGTVSPTGYNMLHNSLEVTPSEIQNVTYKLCHMYYNYVGPIRVPSVCQYAKKLSVLCGQFLHRIPNPHLCDRLYFL